MPMFGKAVIQATPVKPAKVRQPKPPPSRRQAPAKTGPRPRKRSQRQVSPVDFSSGPAQLPPTAADDTRLDIPTQRQVRRREPLTDNEAIARAERHRQPEYAAGFREGTAATHERLREWARGRDERHAATCDCILCDTIALIAQRIRTELGQV